MASRVLEDPVLRVGKVDAKRDFLDVRDLVSAYVTAMAATKFDRGRVLNDCLKSYDDG
jgi:GDP-4-dehydro-6-deoxy-D-mannose reductase